MAAWQQLRLLRHRDMLLGTLLRAFERDQLECRVLQSKDFRPHLNRWAELLVANKKHGAEVDPQEVPPEVLQDAEKSSAEVRWVLRRLSVVKDESHHRGLPHFPSVLKQRGPQYPFQPFELTYLRSVVGSTRGTELNQPIELPEVSKEQREEAMKIHQGRPPRDLWAEGCMDDDDLMDHRKPPKLTRPSSNWVEFIEAIRRSRLVSPLWSRTWVERNLSFTSLLTAPPLTVAPLSQEDLQNGAYLEFRQSWFTRKRHNHLLWLPKKDLSISGPEDGSEVHFDNSLDSFKSMMVLGDSYADDVDMGFHCWPTRLSRTLRLPLLNVARGGSESTHIHAQLERAHAYNRNQQLDLKPEEVLLILHTGGNDALNALLKPWMFTLLLSDLYSLRNSMNSGIPNPKKQELAFATTVSKNIVKELDTLLATAATLGHRKVLISTLPIVSSLPLARLLVHLLVPGSNATFVSEILQIIGGSMNEEIHRACVALAQKHGLQT
eukprot:symbB.v1.2.006959.t1/scaffold416.1/size293898/18